jgi:hypothetical protein
MMGKTLGDPLTGWGVFFPVNIFEPARDAVAWTCFLTIDMIVRGLVICACLRNKPDWGGNDMKKKAVVLIFIVALLAAAGAAYAMEMSGTVSAVDAAKNTFTMKGEKIDAAFDCETGTILKDVKVGDKVTVQYDEVGGKKKAKKISPMTHTKKAPVGC